LIAPSQFGGIDVNDMSWLGSANNFQFDASDFGGYRDTADSSLNDTFFNDALDMDFTTPYNVAPTPVAPEKDLIAQIDAAKEADNANLLTCNKIW
jgi:AP-1-like transcription factor